MKKLIHRIRHDILALFVTLLVFSTAAIVTNLASVITISREIHDIVVIGEELAELEEVQVFLFLQEIAELKYLMTGNSDFQIQRHEAETMTNFHLENAVELQREQGESDDLHDVVEEVDRYERTFLSIDSLYQRGEVEEAIALSITRGDEQISALHHRIDEFVSDAGAVIQTEVAEVDTVMTVMSIVTIISLVVLMMLSVAVWQVSNRVARPILIPTIFLSLAVIVWNFYGIRQLDAQAHELENNVFELIEIEKAQILLLEIDLAGLEYVLTGEDSFLRQHRRRSDELIEQFAIINTLDLRPPEVELIAELRKANTRYHDTFSDVMVAIEQRNMTEATRLTTEDANVHLSDAQISIRRFVRLAEAELGKTLTRADQATQTTILIGVFVLGIYAVVGVIVTTIAGRVITPIVQLIDAAIAIEEESYDMSMLNEVVKREDDIGRLASVFQRLSRTVQGRTTELRHQVTQLRIEIDEAKSLQQVQEILDSDFFKGLEEGAVEMRKRRQRRRAEREQ